MSGSNLCFLKSFLFLDADLVKAHSESVYRQ